MLILIIRNGDKEMNKEIEKMKRVAESAKALYHRNVISREEAKKDIEPYINAFNEKSKEIAKKFKQRPMKISFSKFVR